MNKDLIQNREALTYDEQMMELLELILLELRKVNTDWQDEWNQTEIEEANLQCQCC